MSNAELTRLIMTDYGATLDLGAAEKDNCSITNHAVVAIYFVTYDWRPVTFTRDDGSVDEVIISTTDKWIFFADTLLKGKNNDHITHNACQTYLINFYDKKRAEKNLSKIGVNIVWTDQCPTQYRCRQNFLLCKGKH